MAFLLIRGTPFFMAISRQNNRFFIQILKITISLLCLPTSRLFIIKIILIYPSLHRQEIEEVR